MTEYTVISESKEETVVTKFEQVPHKSEAYQSEASLEKEFIHMLQEQSYEYIKANNDNDLVLNLRKQLEKLNNYSFTDKEWSSFFNSIIANSNDGIVEKTFSIQEDSTKNLIRENGDTQNIKLIDKQNIHNNSLQVINQFEENDGKHKTRYDVTILVNGLPLVHVELKRRSAKIKEAFNQIERYQSDSFWAGSKLFEYVQIFVISNGTDTKYYSNTTRFSHIKDLKERGYEKSGKTSHSFEFTSFWADASNKIIPDLIDFTRTFFAKHTLLNILTKYCVFTEDKMLLVMRPYQIVATERILNRIEIATNYKKYGTRDAGGYIWHTTGSGKTLTSFKTAQLASRTGYIDKVLFVVDRKDLDYQTMREYDKFEKDAANSNTSTAILKKQLEDPNCHIIITTIQKLSIFIKKNPDHPIRDQKVVLIFDECHRSQFGEMHTAITKNFKKYYIFGFTGTPIFSDNASTSLDSNFKTTEDAFGTQLHNYTIINAITDGNVLPFRIDYIRTMAEKDWIKDIDVYDIDREKAYDSPKRIEVVTKYILEHFNQKTYRNDKMYSFNALTNISDVVNSKKKAEINKVKSKTTLNGFNSILCCSSIETAKMYYSEFKKQMEESGNKLKVALIYSYSPNEEELDGILDDENCESTVNMDQRSRDFLDATIDDYNVMFPGQKLNYSTDDDGFQRYYKDVSLRMKNREIDLLIVVNMFLTGFDATTLNTLWVDKNLRMHGLLQAYSRTNRILNSVKRCGNIVCFRNLQKRTDAAISLFGDKDAGGVIVLRSFDDYYNGFNDAKGKYHKGYKEIIEELITNFPVGEQIIGEKKQKEFLVLFGAVLRMRNLLKSFDDFAGNEILSEYEFQDYTSMYLDCKPDKPTGEVTNINDDIVFETELVQQVDINVDYILMMVEKYKGTHNQDKEILIKIRKAIGSSPTLRSKRALIENFLAGINEIEDVLEEWRAYIAEQKEKDLNEIINEENLNELETHKFIENAFHDGYVKTDGVELDKVLPPMSRFTNNNRLEKKQKVIEKLNIYFERFYGIGE